MKTIRLFSNLADACSARAHLEAAGLDATVIREADPSADPASPTISPSA